MKVCRKCKKEYKDAYSFCPKCGTSYDASLKRAKIYYDLSEVFAKIWEVILYVFGGLTILGSLLSFNENPTESSFFILFGLSLFPIFYKLIWNKFSFDEKYLKVSRILIPIFILMLCGVALSNDDEYISNDTENEINNSTEVESSDSVEAESSDSVEVESSKTEDVKQSNTYILKYKELGNYGKLVEYEGDNEYFYYFPSGNYEVKVTSISDIACYLWLDYNEGYKSDFGTSYNNKQRLKFTTKGEKHELTITNDVHLYNSNECNYELERKN